ncbi:MAG: hypothetical protein AAB786_01995 [Patescibacteria group bacterium]
MKRFLLPCGVGFFFFLTPAVLAEDGEKKISAELLFGTFRGGDTYGILDVTWRRGEGKWFPRVVAREYVVLGEHPNAHPEKEFEATVGGGREIKKKGGFSITEEVLFSYARSSTGERAKFLQPVTRLEVALTRRVQFEGIFFPYIPLGHGDAQWFVGEKARVDFLVRSGWKIGGGWGATEIPGRWQHRPEFGVTWTPNSRPLESLEIGIQGKGGMVIRLKKQFHR